MKAREPPALITVAHIAERLRLNPWTIREMLRLGELKGFLIRGRWRIESSDLEEYIERAKKE